MSGLISSNPVLTLKEWSLSELYRVLGSFSIAIVNYRVSKGLSTRQLASLLGISERKLIKCELGTYDMTVSEMLAWCAKMGSRAEIKIG